MSQIKNKFVEGAIPINKGGTGQTTANTALNALLPSQTGNNTKVLTTDGTNTSWQSAGSGGSAGYMGSINWAPGGAGVYWTRQSSSFGAFTANGTITTPTVTNQALDAGNNLPEIKFASMPAGTYRIVAYGTLYELGGSQVYRGYRFSDGTNVTNPVILTTTSASGLPASSVEGVFNYGSTQTNVTISLQGLCASSDTLYVDITTYGFQIDVYYFPNL